VTVDLADLTAPELRQEIQKLRRRVEKLAALLRLALALVHASGFRVSGERLPDGPAKDRILRAVDHARGCLPLRASCGSWVGRRVGFRRGANGTRPVPSTISHHVLPPHRID
jgi:hypothetical protein